MIENFRANEQRKHDENTARDFAPKIIQILIAPNDSTWQGILLGLGDDGITYRVGTGTRWEPMIPDINYKENAEQSRDDGKGLPL